MAALRGRAPPGLGGGFNGQSVPRKWAPTTSHSLPFLQAPSLSRAVNTSTLVQKLWSYCNVLRDDDPLFDYYRHTLEELGKRDGALGQIFTGLSHPKPDGDNRAFQVNGLASHAESLPAVGAAMSSGRPHHI